MAITSELSEDGTTVTIAVGGAFDYHLHQDFLAAFKLYPKGQKQFVLDLANTRSIDGSALGMLLQLKGHNLPDAKVHIINPSDDVLQALVKVEYASLFAIA